MPPQLPRPTVDRVSNGQESEAPGSISDTVAPSQNPMRPATSEGKTAKIATDKPATVSAKQTPDTPVATPNRTTNRTTVQAAPAANKTRTHLADDDEPEEAATASSTPAHTNPLPSHSLSSASTEMRPVKSEALQSSENKKIADNSAQTNHAENTTRQAQVAKAEFQQTLLPTADRPAVYVPQTGFTPIIGETRLAEGSPASTVAAERAGIVERAIEDPGLSVNVMPHSAHLSIAGDTGNLALHVRVRDGSADVNVSGTMAPLFDAKAPEIVSCWPDKVFSLVASQPISEAVPKASRDSQKAPPGLPTYNQRQHHTGHPRRYPKFKLRMTAASTSPHEEINMAIQSTISQIQSAATAAQQATATKNDPSQLGESDFLKLLTTQLQQQDPTQPMDNTAMVASTCAVLRARTDDQRQHHPHADAYRTRHCAGSDGSAAWWERPRSSIPTRSA